MQSKKFRDRLFFRSARKSRNVLRAALSWPREHLYRRPGVLARSEMNGKFQSFGDQGWPVAQDPRTSSGPFGRVGGMNLGPSPAFTSPSEGGPNLTSVTPSAPFANAGSLFGQLGIPLAGPDGLMQTFNRAVDDLARARQLGARRTVVVVQTVVKEKRPQISSKNAAQDSRNTATSGTGQVASEDPQGTAQSTASTAQNQTANALRTTNSVNQNTVNSIRGMTSRPVGGLGSIHAPVNLPDGRR